MLKRHILNLERWVGKTGCLAREETEYLAHEMDLMYAATSYEDEATRLQPFVADVRRRVYELFGKVKYRDSINDIRIIKPGSQAPATTASRDPDIYICSGSSLATIVRFLLAWIVIVLLLVPLLIINAVDSVALRMTVVVIFFAVLIATLAGCTKAKTTELFVSGAT